MATRSKKLSFGPADVASLRANPYIARLIEDAKLRANVQQAFESSSGPTCG